MQSMHITISVVSSNPADGEVYSIHYYEIKFVSDLRRSVVSPDTPVSSNKNSDRHDINELLLKVVLNTIHL